MTRLFTISLSILVTLLSCTKEDRGSYTPIIPVTTMNNNTVSKSYLALGDSYTIGQSVLANYRYPVQAVALLAHQGITFNAPEIIAQTGWTTADLLRHLAASPPLQPQYDIVTLLIGVNNQYQQRTQEEYASEFSTLLDMSLKYAGNDKHRVIVLSIPDYGVTPFANGRDKAWIAGQIDSFNLINKRIALKAGVSYLDVTGFSRQAANDPFLIASDGLHYSGSEYQIWATELAANIKKIL